MTFPRRADETDLPATSLVFAKWFLESQRQQRLLRGGFPSPSSWAVERELEAFQAERARPASDKGEHLHAEASYEVFLTTMQTAIWGGRWAASPQARIDTWVSEALSRLLGDVTADVGTALEELQAKVLQSLKEDTSEPRPVPKRRLR